MKQNPLACRMLRRTKRTGTARRYSLNTSVGNLLSIRQIIDPFDDRAVICVYEHVFTGIRGGQTGYGHGKKLFSVEFRMVFRFAQENADYNLQ